jgi:dethiobiotin synthase
MKRFFITGTDTGVGKTLVSALITKAFDGCYWKPIQSGVAEEMPDRDTVHALTDLPRDRLFYSTYELQAALSPNQAAAQENIDIDILQCEIPVCDRALITEGAGGVFVPLNQRHCMLDLMTRLNFPVIIVTRGTLGTINHTLLTIEALRRRNLTICGVVFNGELNPENQKTIEEWGNVRALFHVPRFFEVKKEILHTWLMQQQQTILTELA